jgi:hypothetical protein
MVYNSSTLSSSQHILDPLGGSSRQLTRSQHNIKEIQGGANGHTSLKHLAIYSNVLSNNNNQSSIMREAYAIEQQHQRTILPATIPPSSNTAQEVMSKFQQAQIRQSQHQLLQQQHQLQLEQNQSLNMTNQHEFDNYSQLGGDSQHTVDSLHFNPNIYDGSLSVANATATAIIGNAAAFSSANSLHACQQTKSSMETSTQLVERVRYSSQIQQDQHVDFLGRTSRSNDESSTSNYMNFESRNSSQRLANNTRQEMIAVNHHERESVDGAASFTRIQVASPVPSEQQLENEVQEMSMFVAGSANEQQQASPNEIILKHSNNTFVINKDFD